MIISSDGIAVLLSATLEDLDCGELNVRCFKVSNISASKELTAFLSY